jgi:hypothetical protein
LPTPTYDAYLPTVLIANVRYLASKIDELMIVAHVNDVDFICSTESWLSQSIPDSALSLSNFIVFRKDRAVASGGGVCVYIRSSIKCRRIKEFENPLVESLWLSVRPRYLPRSISVTLLAVIYHATSSGALENSELYNHIQSNVDCFLCRHPDAVVIVTGDFNPTSTGFNDKHLKRISGLTQIINVPTRQNYILDWCLVNVKAHAYTCSQLPPVGSSDHNAILIKPYLHRKQKPNNSRQWKIDLRDSRVRYFGQWIPTMTAWLEVFDTSDSALKFQKFIATMLLMVDSFFPIKLTRIRQSDKPWMTSSLKIAIRKSQNALHKHGKSSHWVYKFWRGKVQRDVIAARSKFYYHSVIQLKNTNPSRWWREIKTLGGLSSQDLLVPEIIIRSESNLLGTCGVLQ